MGKATTPESREHLTQAISQLPVRITRAIPFGSRARGDYMEYSDWDVVLVSGDFEGIPFHERISSVLGELPVLGVEPFCYTPEEFEKGRDGFGIVGVALQEGIDLIP